MSLSSLRKATEAGENYSAIPLQTIEAPTAEAENFDSISPQNNPQARTGFLDRVTRNNRYLEGVRDRFSNMPSGETKQCLVCVGIIAVIVLSLVIGLIAGSLNGLNYYEMGFKRRRTTGTVDTSRTYTSGLYMIGPDYEFKIFPADAHFEDFESVSVFNADRLEVRISAKMQYFLRPHQLAYLHKKFDVHYRPVLRKNARDAMKGAATLFTNREMIWERHKIEDALFKSIRERMGGRCCEKDCWTEEQDNCQPGCKPYDTCTEADYGLFARVAFFQLEELTLPSGLKARYLQALVLREENEKSQLLQQGIIIRKGTDQLVKQITNSAIEIQQNATAMSELYAAKAEADAKSLIEVARSDGLKHLYEELGITTVEQKTAFDYLRTLRKQHTAQLAVNYDTYVSGPRLGEL